MWILEMELCPRSVMELLSPVRHICDSESRPLGILESQVVGNGGFSFSLLDSDIVFVVS
jgi:hypothetical protein